jgi:hypothetical protein
MVSTKAYPPGGTFLDSIKRSFTDVPVDKEKDNAIATSEFLEAAESLTTLFGITCNSSSFRDCSLTRCIDVMASMALQPVKSDMLGNVEVRAHPSTPLTGPS